MHILASNPDNIGDFIIRLPLYEALLSAGHRLTLLVRSSVVPLALRVVPDDEVLCLKADPYAPSFDPTSPHILELLGRARDLRPDRILVAPFQWTRFEQTLVAGLSSIPLVRLTGFCYPTGDTQLGLDTVANIVAQAVEESGELSKNEALASALLGHPVSLPPPRLEAATKDIEAALTYLDSIARSSRPFLVACVGSSPANQLRRWSREKWAEVLTWCIEHFNVDILLIGTADEYASTEEVRSSSGLLKKRTFNSCRPEGSFGRLLGIISLSKGYLGRDTGPMHLAAALGKPVIALSSGEHWPRFIPNAAAGAVLIARVPCTGCGGRCRCAEPYCLNLLTADHMIAAARHVDLDQPDGFEVYILDAAAIASPEIIDELIRTGPSVSISTSAARDRALGLSLWEEPQPQAKEEHRDRAPVEIAIREIGGMIQKLLGHNRGEVKPLRQLTAEAGRNTETETTASQLATVATQSQFTLLALQVARIEAELNLRHDAGAAKKDAQYLEEIEKLRSCAESSRAEAARLSRQLAQAVEDAQAEAAKVSRQLFQMTQEAEAEAARASRRLAQAEENSQAEVAKIARQLSQVTQQAEAEAAKASRQLSQVTQEAQAEAAKLLQQLAQVTEQRDQVTQQKLLLEHTGTELRDALARATAQAQAIRARGELDQYRQQVRISDLEARLDLANREIAELHATIRTLLAERAQVALAARAILPAVEGPISSAVFADRSVELAARVAEVERLELELQEANTERLLLRDALNKSLALRCARSLGWILGPIRRAFDPDKANTH